MMRRIVSVRFPYLAAERCVKLHLAHAATRQKPWWDETRFDDEAYNGRPKAGPLILVTESAKGTRLSALSEEASELGFWVGQKLSDARAMVPGLWVENHDLAGDRMLINRIAHWMMRYSPSVALNAPQGLLIDSAGCEHLFGGEQGMAEDIAQRFAQMGLSTRIGIADTPAAAMVLSDYSAQPINRLEPDGDMVVLYDFPVDALRLDDDTVILLKRLGLKTIGSVMGLPRAALERRFRKRDDGRLHTAKALSADAADTRAKAVQWRLDQLTGQLREPLSYISEPLSYCVRQSCQQMAQDHEAVGQVLGDLLPALCTQLEKAGRGAFDITLTGYRADGGSSAVSVSLSAPSRDYTMIKRLFRDRLDRIDCGFGIDLFTLSANRTQAIHTKQKALIGGDQEETFGSALTHLSDTVHNRLEGARVYQLSARASHVPERAQYIEGPHLSFSTYHRGSKAQKFSVPRPKLAPRPARLFERPEEAEVIAPLPDGPPAQFVWRRRHRRIIRARGPERILPEWWYDKLKTRTGALIRDYYDVEDSDGQRYWLYRAAYDHSYYIENKNEALIDHSELEDTAARVPQQGADISSTQPGLEWRWYVHGLF